MPTDAKVGLVVGVGLVIAVAVVFFKKEEPRQPKQEVQPAAVSVMPDEKGQLTMDN